MIAEEIARYWIAAAEAGKIDPQDWQRWADRLILHDAALPETWLIDLAAANSLEQLIEWSTDYSMRDPDYDAATLGYKWHQYRDGSIPLDQCLSELGMLAHELDTRIECESFYTILNELDSTGDTAVAAKAAERLCASHVALAMNQLRTLTSDELPRTRTPDL